jgi:hypothetical protein
VAEDTEDATDNPEDATATDVQDAEGGTEVE